MDGKEELWLSANIRDRDDDETIGSGDHVGLESEFVVCVCVCGQGFQHYHPLVKYYGSKNIGGVAEKVLVGSAELPPPSPGIKQDAQ